MATFNFDDSIASTRVANVTAKKKAEVYTLYVHTCIIHVYIQQLSFGPRKDTQYKRGSMWEYVPLPLHTPTLSACPYHALP